MSVLVTGGAGFVGSHLVDRLCSLGEHVIVMDDFSTGRVGNLESGVTRGGATIVLCDVAVSPKDIEQRLNRTMRGGLTAIYHLASPASPTAYAHRPWETLRVNSLGTMSLIEIALEHHALFFYTSTSEVYGDPTVNPQPESYFGHVNSVGPRACYDEGKRFAEAAISVMARERALNARIVRLFNCYGPRMQLGDGRLIPALFEAALAGKPLPIQGSGTQTRSLTYVDDVIDGIIHIASSPHAGASPVNIGTEQELSVREIASRVAQVCGVPDQVVHCEARPEDPMQRRPQLNRARLLGWEPVTMLDDGLRKTLPYFRAEAAARSAA